MFSVLPGSFDLAGASDFQALMQRVRAGDEAAAAELVQQYEPAIRRTVRIWLVDARLRRMFDSMDICQSVLGSFFIRTALGQYQLDQPEQLIRLLVSMAKNKLADQVRKEQAGRRDRRRVESGDVHHMGLAGQDPTPSRHAAGRDLLSEIRKRLSEEERQLADQRAQGREWSEIAAQLGGNPEALRKRLTRAVNRVARELGLDGQADE
jgi:RNA polymerase sigma factor (sigma-70 family)